MESDQEVVQMLGRDPRYSALLLPSLEVRIQKVWFRMGIKMWYTVFCSSLNWKLLIVLFYMICFSSGSIDVDAIYIGVDAIKKKKKKKKRCLYASAEEEESSCHWFIGSIKKFLMVNSAVFTIFFVHMLWVRRWLNMSLIGWFFFSLLVFVSFVCLCLHVLWNAEYHGIFH